MYLLIIKSFHIVAMVTWFAGLFYLPRLFVYHAETTDAIGQERFKLMERRLYYGIVWPSALVTISLGIMLMSYNFAYYLKAGWMHAKLALVLLLWLYHLTCGYFLNKFAGNKTTPTALFFRIFNELPVFLLVGIVLLVIVKP